MSGRGYLRVLTHGASGSLEHTQDDDATLPDRAVLLERLRAELAYLEAKTGTAPDQQAVDALLADADHGLAVLLGEGPDAALTPRDQAGLEAVVHSDGSRPVLFVEDDFVDVLAPEARLYGISLGRVVHEVRRVCRAVGRVDDPSGKLGCRGTAWAIGDGLVATNYHVLRAIATASSRADGEWVGSLKPEIAIDFGREIGGGGSGRRFPVKGVVGVGRAGEKAYADKPLAGINFDALDVAVLELEPVAGQRFPEPVKIARADDPKTRGGLATKGREIYLVGFPVQPRSTTSDIFGALFRGVAGVKRLTPGELTAGRGDVPGDPRKWVIGHDASTLGGSSGSLVVDLVVDGGTVLGIHFAGQPGLVNWGHGLEGATVEFDALLRGG